MARRSDLDPARAQPAPASAGPPDPKLVEDLVAANRILVAQSVLDGYGHVSARHDRDPNRYLMSRSLASELVTAGTLGRPWELWKRKAVARQEEP